MGLLKGSPQLHFAVEKKNSNNSIFGARFPKQILSRACPYPDKGLIRLSEISRRKRTRKIKRGMKPDRPVRQFGQRSLPPPFFSASRYSVLGFPGEEKEPRVSNEGTQLKSSKPSVSLSDFLDRKLARTNSTNTPSVQEKRTSFSSIRSLNARVGITSDGACNDSTLDRVIFNKLKCTANEEGLVIGGSTACGSTGEILPQSNKDRHESRKRKNPLAVSSGEDDRYSSSKYLVVLGDDPKPRQKGRKKKSADMKPKPLFNHYANGSGWWDCDREGVDNEEVGCNETWEGMGSTTLGGLEWH